MLKFLQSFNSSDGFATFPRNIKRLKEAQGGFKFEKFFFKRRTKEGLRNF
jgi:hypothetical protein